MRGWFVVLVLLVVVHSTGQRRRRRRSPSRVYEVGHVSHEIHHVHHVQQIHHLHQGHTVHQVNHRVYQVDHVHINKDCNKNCKNLVLDVIKTFGTSNQAKYYNLQNICFSSLIDLDTLTIMSPKMYAPYLWIRPLCLTPLNLAYGLL